MAQLFAKALANNPDLLQRFNATLSEYGRIFQNASWPAGTQLSLFVAQNVVVHALENEDELRVLQLFGDADSRRLHPLDSLLVLMYRRVQAALAEQGRTFAEPAVPSLHLSAAQAVICARYAKFHHLEWVGGTSAAADATVRWALENDEDVQKRTGPRMLADRALRRQDAAVLSMQDVMRAAKFPEQVAADRRERLSLFAAVQQAAFTKGGAPLLAAMERANEHQWATLRDVFRSLPPAAAEVAAARRRRF